MAQQEITSAPSPSIMVTWSGWWPGTPVRNAASVGKKRCISRAILAGLAKEHDAGGQEGTKRTLSSAIHSSQTTSRD